MSVRTYNPSVRVGNWNEDLWLEEDLLKDFVDKRDKKELAIFKASKLSTIILQHVTLSKPRNGNICFRDVICVHHPYTKENLTLNMSHDKLYNTVVFPPCGLTTSKILHPSYRNAFMITSCDDSTVDGDYLKYGQQFFLSTLQGIAGDLKLSSERATLYRSAKKSRHSEVSLTSNISYACHWHILHFDPQRRLETKGEPVPAHTKLLIVHSKTNEGLAALEKYGYSTPFGKEHEVAAHTFLDSHKAEGKENHWVFVAYNDDDNNDKNKI